VVVTIQEASIFLQIDEFETKDEALEFQLFELKLQLISKPIIPQLLLARKAKLKQLKEICNVLSIEIKQKFNSFKINKLDSINLIQSFNDYQKNKSLILSQLARDLTIQTLDAAIDDLLLNLKYWSKLWPELDVSSDEKILLSKELESMEFYQVLKEMNSVNVLNFNDLLLTNIPDKLNIEIKRLNLISVYFSQD
jgi:hypothetical protein